MTTQFVGSSGKKSASSTELDLPMQFANTCVSTPVSLDVLLDILQYRRFSRTDGEAAMIKKYIACLPGIEQDAHGNYWLTIADGQPQAGNMFPAGEDDQGRPRTLFSCHTDTVEKRQVTGRKKLHFDDGMVSTKGGGVLGADDGTGIWIVLNLIKAKVPGLYIFHRDEELGGKGSAFIANQLASSLVGVKRAVAFDRKGTTDIITHQGFERCCSDAFAVELASQLNRAHPDGLFAFAGDDSGTFTDTKNYTEIIPECTNLAVGYYDQHTLHECQDLTFATHLVQALLSVQWDQLPTARDPAVVEDLWTRTRSSAHQDADFELRELAVVVRGRSYAMAQYLLEQGFDAYELERLLDDYEDDEEGYR